MLILSRKWREKLLIGDDITVQVTHIGPNSVKLAITAPKGVLVLREELKPHPIQAGPEQVADLGRRRGEFLEADEVADIDVGDAA